MELAAVRGKGAEELCFARLDAVPGNYGGRMNVKWNEQFAVAMLGLGDRVNTSGPPGWAMVQSEFGMNHPKAAIVAVPKAQPSTSSPRSSATRTALAQGRRAVGEDLAQRPPRLPFHRPE